MTAVAVEPALSAAPTAPVLLVEHLAKAYGGVRAVDDVSFSVETGALVALIGPNGAGKTTTFNIINGQIAPDSGRVRLAGEDVTGLASRELSRRRVGRTFQITATFASMTVAENVQVALASRDHDLGMLRSAAGSHADEMGELLSLVGMEEQAGRTCGLLAYGDLKRVELAMALANRPRLLLMDEPTAGMAPRERGALMALASELARRREVAVLFTEHDMAVVFTHATRILVMNRGRLIAQGAPAEVRRDPIVREVYLGHGEGDRG
jgi:branched-chain amino acid transport system ATP-binding protein